MSHVACPSREQVADYLLDTLGESVADRVMEHSETCAECDRTIEWLEDASDSVVAKLRQPLAGDDYCNHSAYQRLIGALEELKLAKIEPAVGTLTATETAPRVNDQLDEYRLLEKLGHGGIMGSVYRNLHTKLDQVVALKVLSHERVKHNGAVSRFEREMKAVGKLDHPNIVHAYDSGEDDDTHYLVTNFVRGIDDEVDVADVERGASADGHAHATNAVDELTDTTAWDAEDGRAPLDDALLQETLVITRRAESHINGLLTEGSLPSVDFPAVGCIKPIDARQPAVWMSWSPYAENELLPRSACWKTVEHDVTELQSSEHHDLLTAKIPDTRWYAWDIPIGIEVRPRALLPADMVATRVSPLGAFVVGRGLNSSLVMLRRSSVRMFDFVADPLLVEAVVNSLDDSLLGVLALSRGNGILRTMHPDGAPPRQLADVSSMIQPVHWSDGGESLVAPCAAPGAGSTSTFLLYGVSQDKVVQLKVNDLLNIGLFELSSDGRWLATLSQSAKKIVVWNISEKIANTIRVWGSQATALRFVPHSSAVAYGSQVGAMYLMDALAVKNILQLHGDQADITELIVSRDGLCLVLRAAQHHVSIWNPGVSPTKLAVMGKTKRLMALTLSPDGMLLAATGSDYPGGSSVRIGMWQLTTDDLLWNTQQWTQ